MKLELKEIVFRYSDDKASCSLLDGLNLSVPSGIVTALVGSNGVGKTTLFNIISGFETRYEGSVLLDECDLRGLSPHERAIRGIGRLFQGSRLAGDLTLMENMMLATGPGVEDHPLRLLFSPRTVRREEQKQRENAVQLLHSFFGESAQEYIDKADRPASELSYGQQRLIALVRLLMGQAELLLLDEPTSGVNPVFVARMQEIIRGLAASGKTVLMIEHNLGFVREVADECAFLENGKITMKGPVRDVLENERVRNSYLGL